MSDASDVLDVVVLGAGAGGEAAAHRLARAGLSVAIIESRLVGGECPFYGCTPSKLLVRSADAVAEARRADQLAGPVQVRPDFAIPRERIREANHHWHDDGHVEPLEESGVTVVRGHGRLAGTGRVEVTTEDGVRVLTAARGVVLNSGTRPAVPPVDGLADTPFWTNREVFHTEEVPPRLVVVGGGPIGCELAQAFARYGSRVTLLEVADRLLSGEEPESGELIARVLRAEGLDVRLSADLRRVDHDGVFRVQVGEGTIEAERLLVAAGRTPNLSDVGLETVGLDPEAETVPTDERMRAGERLWAVGDITGHGAYTHMSRYQAAIVVRQVLGLEGPTADYRAVTRVTYTDPEVAGVGLTEAEAREQGCPVVTAVADIARSSRGWIHGDDTAGVIKLVVDRERQVLVGATAAGPAGGEVLGLLSLAVHAATPVGTLRTLHFPYPTFHRAIESALARLDLPGMWT